MNLFKITFIPFDKTVEVGMGTSLLGAAGKAGIVIDSVCGGDGICGRCNLGEKYVCKDGPVFSMAQLKELPPE